VSAALGELSARPKELHDILAETEDFQESTRESREWTRIDRFFSRIRVIRGLISGPLAIPTFMRDAGKITVREPWNAGEKP
jgi:hypothetical protein